MGSEAVQKKDLYDRLSRQMEELRLFAELCSRGLEYSVSATEIHDIVRRGIEAGIVKRGITSQQLEQQREQAVRLERFAKDQAERDFPYLYGLLTLRVWTILEDVVNNVVLDRLSNKGTVLGSPTFEGLSIPLVPFLSADEQSRDELILEALKQATKSRLKIGMGRFDSLLDAVGLGGGLSDTIRRTVLELSELRNVLVHRDGVCDNRVPERCPWLGLRVGDRVSISRNQFLAYALLPQWLFIELHRRGKQIEPDAFEVADLALKEFEQRMGELLSARSTKAKKSA
jgi:hypothetical protein